MIPTTAPATAPAKVLSPVSWLVILTMWTLLVDIGAGDEHALHVEDAGDLAGR